MSHVLFFYSGNFSYRILYKENESAQNMGLIQNQMKHQEFMQLKSHMQLYINYMFYITASKMTQNVNFDNSNKLDQS